MRSLLIASLVILCSIKASSQYWAGFNEPYIYGEVGGGAYGAALNANANGLLKMTLNVITGKKNIFSFSLYSMVYAGFGDVNTPGLSMLGLSYGKVFFLTPFIRFTVKGGIAYDGFIIPTDYVQATGNYNSTMSENVFGFVFDPTIEFPLSRWFGFSIGPYVNINSVSSFIGVGASMMFGKIRGSMYRY